MVEAYKQGHNSLIKFIWVLCLRANDSLSGNVFIVR
jgi:hypothetical protein